MKKWHIDLIYGIFYLLLGIFMATGIFQLILVFVSGGFFVLAAHEWGEYYEKQ